jgi:t-SNARE complex subunit (syntaxin)
MIESLKDVEQKLVDIRTILETMQRHVTSLNHVNITLKEQKQYIDEIRKDLSLIEERQNGLNIQLGQALNTLITQSKTPAILQLGLFAIILIMFAVNVLGWKVGGSYGGIKFESNVKQIRGSVDDG